VPTARNSISFLSNVAVSLAVQNEDSLIPKFVVGYRKTHFRIEAILVLLLCFGIA